MIGARIYVRFASRAPAVSTMVAEALAIYFSNTALTLSVWTRLIIY